MRVLVCGANGFIGSAITAMFLEHGHDVVAAVRRPNEFLRRFPGVQAVETDFNTDTNIATWLPRLNGIDAIVNCVGILQGSRRQNAEAIHHLAPVALFKACERANVRRVIQISAVSADERAGTAYAATKLKADNALRALDLDWIILRPSLIINQGSYGGTSLLRGLAAIPFAIPVVGRGDQPFRPIHMKDLCAGVTALLEQHDVLHVVLEPGGPDVVTLKQILLKLRAWLGLAPVRVVEVPRGLIRVAVRLGDWLGAATLNTTAFRQLEYGNTGDPADFTELSGIRPAGVDTWLCREPSRVQDRWHARLYFLRPTVRYGLALIWLCSGAVGLLNHDAAAGFLAVLPGRLIPPAVFGSCALDMLIGILIVCKWRPAAVAIVQVIIVIAYTLFLTAAQPALWAAPLGPLVKNVAVFLLIPVWAILENDR